MQQALIVTDLTYCADRNRRSKTRKAWRLLILPSIVVALMGCIESDSPNTPREIAWDDLVPEEQTVSPEKMQFPIVHSFSAPIEQYVGDVVPELNGERIKISAFIVPLDGDAEVLSELMLVPYFGACIHVPPPPSNQIIYAGSDQMQLTINGYDLQQPVWATGTLFTDSTEHELAKVGYRMTIESIAEYRFN